MSESVGAAGRGMSRPSWSMRLRDAWAGAHAPVPGVPRWARIAALIVPFTVLPSSLWRIAGVTLHLPILNDSGGEQSGNLPSWLPIEVYVVILSIVSELLAFTAVGLVSTWGEVVPRWVPFLRGRRVPPLAAVIPGAVGATILTVMWTWTAITFALGRTIQGRPHAADFPLNPDTWQGVLAIAAYLPLLAWGPLLAAATVAYHRRRTRRVRCETVGAAAL